MAVLDANSSRPQPMSLYRIPSDTSLEHLASSQPKASYSTKQASVMVVFSDLDSDTYSQISNVVGEEGVSASKNSSFRFSSPTSRQSGRIRKLTRKIESQRRHATEGESELKKMKIRGTKLVDVTGVVGR